MALSKLSALGVLAIAASIVPAQAALMVNIGGAVVGGVLVGGSTYSDNQAGVDSNPSVGVLDIGAFLNTVALNFTINGYAATSASPVASLASTANINLVKSVTLPVIVDVFITDTGFSDPSTPLNLDQTVNLLSSIGGVTATATATGWYGAGNTEFEVNGPSTADAKAAIVKGVAINVPGLSGTINGPALYSLTTHINLNVSARGTDPVQNIQLNSNLAAHGEQIPEPSTTLLLSFGLLGLGALLKMRK
jgi:hypothetical protein